MRSEVDREKLVRLMQALGRRAQGPGRIYFTGGASALLIGWRAMTVDVDIRLDPEPAGIFEAIRDIKRELDVNIELASPQDFLPELPGWRDRSVFIARHGAIDFFHYDFRAQALSKISRGHARDLSDVETMLAEKLCDVAELRSAFEAIEPGLLRFPNLDAEALSARVAGFLGQFEGDSDTA